MILNKRIPPDFYKLFHTRNREAYMQFLVAIYKENNEIYAAIGLTVDECRAIIETTMMKAGILWQEDEEEETDAAEGIAAAADAVMREEIVTREDTDEVKFPSDSPSGILNRLIRWGWLKSDFDEKLNTYIISFPVYSQLYTELFLKLGEEEDSRERESILSIYSALFTYVSDSENNNDILKSALQTSRRLGQLLSNMQDGMREYFDELSGRKDFLGIQEVLVEEINNRDSKKYAILTTTDSFYRYKEAVKELIAKILGANDRRREKLQQELENTDQGQDTLIRRKNRYKLKYCEEASRLVYQIEREFDVIERKYNKLIEQKTIFAKRALARIHYILREGTGDEDGMAKLIRLLNNSEKKDEILEELGGRIRMTASFKNLTDDSFSARKERSSSEFVPMDLKEKENQAPQDIADFIPKPLYTKHQLRSFREKNMVGDSFVATEQTVQSMEDLEKLLFLWQEETENHTLEDNVSAAEEIHGTDGFTYSKLIIRCTKTKEEK